MQCSSKVNVPENSRYSSQHQGLKEERREREGGWTGEGVGHVGNVLKRPPLDVITEVLPGGQGHLRGPQSWSLLPVEEMVQFHTQGCMPPARVFLPHRAGSGIRPLLSQTSDLIHPTRGGRGQACLPPALRVAARRLIDEVLTSHVTQGWLVANVFGACFEKKINQLACESQYF